MDKIIGLVSTNVNKMIEDVISGAADYTTEDPSGDLLPQVEQKYKDRFLIGAGYPNTYFFFMNASIPPFNKLAARQAVNYAIDSRALIRIFGGRVPPTRRDAGVDETGPLQRGLEHGRLVVDLDDGELATVVEPADGCVVRRGRMVGRARLRVGQRIDEGERAAGL